MRKFHMFCISVLVLLLGTAVTFGASGSVFVSVSVTSDPLDSDFATGCHSVCAPGTDTYDWEYTIQSDASAAIIGSGTGLAKGAGTSIVRGSIATADTVAEAERTSTGTTSANDTASNCGTKSMTPSDCLEFDYSAFAYADWTTGSCTVIGTGFGYADGTITLP